MNTLKYQVGPPLHVYNVHVFWILSTLGFCSHPIKILWPTFIFNLQPTQPYPPSSSFAAATCPCPAAVG